MKTDSRAAVILLALDALQFADRISDEWGAHKQIRHLREQIALARKHLESEPAEHLLIQEVEVIKKLKALLFEDGRQRTCITQGDFDFCINQLIHQKQEQSR